MTIKDEVEMINRQIDSLKDVNNEIKQGEDMKKELSDYKPHNIQQEVINLIDLIENCNDFDSMAWFRLGKLDIIKKAIKEVSEALDERMIEIGGEADFEEPDVKVFIGKVKTKKVPLLEGITQLFEYFSIDDVVSCLSTSAIKHGAYGKLIADHNMVKDLTVVKETDNVQVKEIIKKFIK